MKTYLFKIMSLKRCITFTILTFPLILLILFIHGGEVFTQTPTMDCEGTIRSWKLSHPNLNCRCVNGRPVCDKQSTGSGGEVPLIFGGSPEQMAMQIILQGIMQGLFSEDTALERERQIELRLQKIKDEKEREIVRQKEWENLSRELLGVYSDKLELMGVKSDKLELMGTGADDDSPAPSTVIKEAFVIAVCANAGDLTSGCLDKTVNEANLKLGGMFVKSYIMDGHLNDIFRLAVPNFYSRYQTIQILLSLEKRTINTVVAQLESDLRRLRAFNWPTEAEKKRALLIILNDQETINKWSREAREEANKGINWYHNWDGDESSVHDFHPGPAYEQLKTISSLGWLNR